MWYILSLTALFLFGIQRFLYQVSVQKKCDTAITTFTFMVTVSLLGTLFLFGTSERIIELKYLLTISFINGAAFLTATICTIEALKHLSGNIVYPFTRFNTILVVIFSIFYFRDAPSVYQIAGLFFAVPILFFFTRCGDTVVPDKNPQKGLLFALAGLISGAVAAISSKFAALNVNPFGFITVSYMVGAVLSYLVLLRLRRFRNITDFSDSIFLGVVIGVVNFFGFYFLMKAMSEGPLSMIITITGMHFVIATMLSSIIYRELIDFKRATAMIATIVSLVLMRL